MINLHRYQIKALQYRHLDESQLMHDFRANKRVKPEIGNIHYLGFEIRTPDQTLFHHATVLSDGLDTLCGGIELIHHSLVERFPDPVSLRLVYLRSYLTIDVSVFDHRLQDIMRNEMENSTRLRDIDYFTAYGLKPDGKIEQLRVKTQNAVEAFAQLQQVTCKSGSDQELTFLWAYSAHPVSAEYAEHFDYAENRLRMMIDESVDWKSAAVN